jgi:transposase, IS5 family
MKQISLFVSAARGQKGKVTKREQFLSEMDQVIPWARLIKVIEPRYPKRGNGRPPMPLERMLRAPGVQPGCLAGRFASG